MKRPLLVISHLLVLLVAFLVWRDQSVRANDGTNSLSSPAGARSSTAAKSSRSTTTGPDGIRSTRRRSPAEYAAAWHGLAARRLPRTERQRLQVELLKSWAEVDLKGALTAALDEPWHEISWPGQIEELLRKGFEEAFVDQGPAVWRMIQDQELGVLESALVRNSWMQVVTGKDSQLLVPYLPDMHGLVLGRALTTLGRSVRSRKDADALWEVTSKLHLDKSDHGALRNLAYASNDYFSEKDLREKLASGNETLTILAATTLAVKISQQDAGTALVTIGEIPEHLRGDYAFELMKNGHENHPVVAGAIHHLVENAHWDLVADPLISKRVRALAEAGEPGAMAAWAVQLPERIEAKEIIHRSVAPFARDDPDGAWEWLGELPDGLWRDRAYAEYSQQALWSNKDPERSRAALDKIRDPAFQQEAEGWRQEWVQRTGSKSD